MPYLSVRIELWLVFVSNLNTFEGCGVTKRCELPRVAEVSKMSYVSQRIRDLNNCKHMCCSDVLVINALGQYFSRVNQ